MRLFTALDLPDDVVRNLEILLDRLRPTARLKWSQASNMHITTRFIGEWPEERIQEMKAALQSVPDFAPIPIRVSKVGYFPNPHSPRVFWAGVQAPNELKRLAAETDRAMAGLGLPAEDREFSPHLTLARIKERVPMQDLRETIAAMPSLEFGEFVADRFYLYQSRTHPAGSVYTKLAEFPFTK